MPIVYLGNHSALDGGHPIPGTQTTSVVFMDEDDLDTRMRTLTHEDGVWVRHSTEPPAWVQSDDEELETAIAAYFNCPVGRPNDWRDATSERTN